MVSTIFYKFCCCKPLCLRQGGFFLWKKMAEKLKNKKTLKKTNPVFRSQKKQEEILSQIASGKSLSRICEENGWPKTSVYEWLAKNCPEQYAQAMRTRADVYRDEIISIADDENLVTNEDVAKAKLKIETRKWLMGKMAPKKYGDKVEVDHGLTDELKEIVVEFVR